MKIKTEVLKGLVSKAVKGNSFDKMQPITTMMEIQAKGNQLQLTTRDNVNSLVIMYDELSELAENFYAVVPSEVFSKLVSKMTSEMTELTMTDDVLTVQGNGTYKIALPLDEEGHLIQLPDVLESMPTSDEGVVVPVHLSTLKTVYNTCKASIAKKEDAGAQYMNYFFGNQVLTTDSNTVCCFNNKVLFDKPVLLAPSTADLFDVMTEEDVRAYLFPDGRIMFLTSTCAICSKVLSTVNEFSDSMIMDLVNSDYESQCAVSKPVLMATLDRLALFVGAFDNNTIRLTFSRNGLVISSKNSTSAELIEYKSSQDFKDFTCLIDVKMLASLVKVQPTDYIEIWYGNPASIKITNGNIIQILALSEETF